jgi:hypothetical protein
MTRSQIGAILALLISSAAVPAAAQISSVYTSLGGDACRAIRVDEETGSTSHRCRGIRGFTLVVHDSDLRVSIDVYDPSGRRHPLDFWTVVTPRFSSLGPRAEWRTSNGRVRALIVRVNANEDPERPNVATSYLVVARPVRGRWCVTNRIRPSPDANSVARRAADAASARCLSASS